MPGARRKTQETQQATQTAQAKAAPAETAQPKAVTPTADTEVIVKPAKGHVVAKGLSITGKGGKVFSPGSSITSSDVEGDKAFEQLIARKCVVKAE